MATTCNISDLNKVIHESNDATAHVQINPFGHLKPTLSTADKRLRHPLETMIAYDRFGHDIWRYILEIDTT